MIAFLLSRLGIRLFAAGALALILFGGGFRAGYKWEAGRFASFKAEVAAAQEKADAAARAEQAALDAAALRSAEDYGQKQAAEAARSAALLEQVKHAPTPRSCIRWGFIRLLDAAALGADQSSLAFPAGAASGACSPYGWTALARRQVENLNHARANAVQLDALIAAWRSQEREHAARAGSGL